MLGSDDRFCGISPDHFCWFPATFAGFHPIRNNLLNNRSKAGIFRDSMGFDEQSLGDALTQHLIDNFEGVSQPVGGGYKVRVTGPMTGPSSETWGIKSVWGIDPDGLIRLIAAQPG
jgi:hypothetical protein